MRQHPITALAYLLLGIASVGLAREAGKMAIVSAEARPDGVVNVTTTGASFDFDTKKSEIRITALLADGQPTATLTLDRSLDGLKLVDHDRDLCHLEAPGLLAQVDFGSILELQSTRGLVVKCNGKADVSLRSFGPVPQRPGVFSRWYACVQPARHFDYEAYFNDRVVHINDANEKVCSSDENIRMARDFYHANILLMWARTWKGQWRLGTFEPVDEAGFKRNIATAHALGMNVIIYSEEFPGGRCEGGLDGFLKRMIRGKEKFGLDGFYFDGLAADAEHPTGSWEKNVVLLREARRLMRDGIIIQHEDGEETSVFADHMHFGEHIGSFSTLMNALFRRTAKGWAVGNLIENAPGIDEAFIDQLLDHNAAMRFGEWYVYGDDGFQPGTGFGWDARFLHLYRDYYLPKLGLKQLRQAGGTTLSADVAADRERELQAQLDAYRQWQKNIEAKRIPLGYKPTAITASSVLDPRYNKWICAPEYAADGSVLEIWMGSNALPGSTIGRPAGGKPEAGVAEWLQVDYGRAGPIARIVYDTTFPDHEKDIWQESFTISASSNGKQWTPVITRRDLKASERFDVALPSPITARYLKVHNILSHFEGYPRWRMAYVTDLQAYGPGAKREKGK